MISVARGMVSVTMAARRTMSALMSSSCWWNDLRRSCTVSSSSADLGGQVIGVTGDQVAQPCPDDGGVVGDAVERPAHHQRTERAGHGLGANEAQQLAHEALVERLHDRARGRQGRGQAVV